jgi:hypothetical protein
MTPIRVPELAIAYALMAVPNLQELCDYGSCPELPLRPRRSAANAGNATRQNPNKVPVNPGTVLLDNIAFNKAK